MVIYLARIITTLSIVGDSNLKSVGGRANCFLLLRNINQSGVYYTTHLFSDTAVQYLLCLLIFSEFLLKNLGNDIS